MGSTSFTKERRVCMKLSPYANECTSYDPVLECGFISSLIFIWPHGGFNILSKYHALYPNKLTKSRYPKAKSLMPTHHTWISHDGLPKPFLGHFIVEHMFQNWVIGSALISIWQQKPLRSRLDTFQ